MIIDTDNLDEARKAIEKLYGRGIVIVRGGNDSFNRKILENKKADILLSPERGGRKDRLKQGDSGLNHVLCRIARQNNIAIGIDFKEMLDKKEDEGKKQLAEHLRRIMQNIRLCKKAKTNMILMSKSGRDDYDLRAFLSTLGMPTDMAKRAVEGY